MIKITSSITFTNLYRLVAVAALLMAFVTAGAAQSTDVDNPTPMTTSIVTGKSNGKAKTVYYSFTASAADPGEVKVKVTASTDERSTSLRVNFLDDEGQKVMDEIYVIPNREPAVKVGKHTFADRQKVIMRITLPDDPQVKLLNYKVEVSGAVEFETAQDATPTEPPVDGAAAFRPSHIPRTDRGCSSALPPDSQPSIPQACQTGTAAEAGPAPPAAGPVRGAEHLRGTPASILSPNRRYQRGLAELSRAAIAAGRRRSPE